MLSFYFFKALLRALHYFLCCNIFNFNKSILDFLILHYLAAVSIFYVVFLLFSNYIRCYSDLFYVSD